MRRRNTLSASGWRGKRKRSRGNDARELSIHNRGELWESLITITKRAAGTPSAMNAGGSERRPSSNGTGKGITFALSIGRQDSRKILLGPKRIFKLLRGYSRCRRMSSLLAALLKAYLQFPAKQARAAQLRGT